MICTNMVKVQREVLGPLIFLKPWIVELYILVPFEKIHVIATVISKLVYVCFLLIQN